MPDVDPDTLELIDKLLRLAAPSSGTTIHERTVAALEAARLISENGIALAEQSVKGRRKNAKTVSPNAWVLSLAPYHCGCSNCGKLISPRDIVWVRVRPDLSTEFRHNYSPCRVMAM
jgi:hypothetical protein